MVSERYFLCRVDDLAEEGSARGFPAEQAAGEDLFLVRQGDLIKAYRDICPHYGATRLAWKRDNYLSGDRKAIMCSAHGALFRLDDGLCVSGPCLGQYLNPVRLEIDDGSVWLLPN